MHHTAEIQVQGLIMDHLQPTYHIGWVNDMKTKTVDCNDDFSVLIDDQAGKTLGLSLNLASEKCTAIVGKRPTELQVFSHQSLGRSIAWNCLELFNQSCFWR